jgi:hypothetical protein
VAALALFVGTTACTTHHVALTRACPTIVGRGVTALPKIGLAPAELKVQQKC